MTDIRACQRTVGYSQSKVSFGVARSKQQIRHACTKCRILEQIMFLSSLQPQTSRAASSFL